MDTLSLVWAPSAKPAVKPGAAELVISINQQPLTQLLARFAERQQIGPVKDSFVQKRLFQPANMAAQWRSSLDQQSYLIALVCPCQDEDCSHLGIRSVTADNWVHWQLDPLFSWWKPYEHALDVWFHRDLYHEQIQHMLNTL